MADINYDTVVSWDATIADVGYADADNGAILKGLAISGLKITTGAPTATVGKWLPGALVQNVIDGTTYQNTGTTASPTWSLLDAGGSGITALTGDVTASGSGSVAATIANSAVTTAKIAANAVDGTKIALTSQATGDIMYYNGTDWVVLPIGTAGQTLTVNAGATAPEWA